MKNTHRALAAALLVGGTTAATAAPTLDGAYFCVPEMSGGLHYNKVTNNWESARFKPGEKFVLRVTAHAVAGKLDTYKVTHTPAGTNFTSPCNSDGNDYAQFFVEGRLQCSYTAINKLFVSFKTGRFVEADLSGYWLHTNEESKSMDMFLTSTVKGGTCTKIE
jgi:hypothetical protein